MPYQRRWIADRSTRKVWVASRQIGKSFALSLDAVSEALASRCDNLVLSRSQRQSREMMRKVKDHLRVFGALSAGALDALDDRAEDVTLPGGSRIISLPASPDTVRGFSGNVFLDEFAFHSDDREIYKAVYPYTTRGYKIRICSTPNGLGNMFADIVTRPDTPFSVHSTTIHEARAEGFEVDIDDLRRGIPHPDDWAQEYECRFVDEATALLTYDLIQSAEDALATEDVAAWTGSADRGDLYLGVDIGRHRDLTAFWLLELVGDVMWTRAAMVMHRAPFALQRERLYGLMDVYGIRRACIDATGLGMQLAEEARVRYGSRVEQVTFTGAVKEDLAITMMRRFQDRLVRVPASTAVREDLHSVQKVTTAAGNVRYDAQRSDAGHADRFWALALAVQAAGTMRGPIEYEQVAARTGFNRAKGCW
jgi:phage FluMu gp28-like protein